MALKNILILGSLLATLMISQVTYGQVDIPSPRFRYKEVESPDSTRPFATPGVFDYDTQVFAPIEFGDGDQLEPNTGFFCTYDRTYLSVNKSGNIGNSTSIPTGTNYQWGTRMELGWMSSADDGWSMAYQYGEGSYFTAGQDVLVANPMLVTTNLATFEINKVFRQALSRGGYFEPYLGLRYDSIADKTIEDTNQVLNGVQVGNRFKQRANNDAVGFQAGGRFNNRTGRWRTTCDGAIATSYNQQRYFSTDIANSATTQGIIENYFASNAFVPIVDFQLELAYHISRDISIRTGAQVVYAWNGINRVNTLTTNLNPNSAFGTAGGTPGIITDHLLTAGFLFGFEWRR